MLSRPCVPNQELYGPTRAVKACLPETSLVLQRALKEETNRAQTCSPSRIIGRKSACFIRGMARSLQPMFLFPGRIGREEPCTLIRALFVSVFVSVGYIRCWPSSFGQPWGKRLSPYGIPVRLPGECLSLSGRGP